MYKIIRKKYLNQSVVMMDISAELVAKKAQAGQFIILRVDEDGERIPLTVAGYDREEKTVKIIFQIVGATTLKLSKKEEGEYISDFVGPLGLATELKPNEHVLVVGGGVGTAIALPIAKKLKEIGSSVTSVIGFRNKELVILEDEFNDVSDELILMTDDGSYGEKGNVCLPIERFLASNKHFDRAIVIGPLMMMKFVVSTLKPSEIPCTVSMNPIMIDGTGMCGGCRLTLVKDGKKITKFACVDGPDFNGYEIDFDEAMSRLAMYKDFERRAYDKECNLLKKEVE